MCKIEQRNYTYSDDFKHTLECVLSLLNKVDFEPKYKVEADMDMCQVRNWMLWMRIITSAITMTHGKDAFTTAPMDTTSTNMRYMSL